MEWKVGYWYWPGPSMGGMDVSSSEQVRIDLLYFRAGEFNVRSPHFRPDAPEMRWPEQPPHADAYVAVVRCEGPGCHDEKLITNLTEGYGRLKRAAAAKDRKLIGLQIDYDCPTENLDSYGHFLTSLRKAMPDEDRLSVTVLLDWFASGIAVAAVIQAADEFVPQFYDTTPRKIGDSMTGIAEPIDPRKWAPVFNAFRKPYRIGIASFGRMVAVSKQNDSACPGGRPGFLADSPLNVMSRRHGRFVRQGRSSSGEIIAHFHGGGAGEFVKMIIPTAQSISSAYDAAKAMGGTCSGVIFFRHPTRNEALALSPEEISPMISGKEARSVTPSVESLDGFCATVACSDLFIRLGNRFPEEDRLLVVRCSGDLEYFVPDRYVQAKMSGPRLIRVRIPAFAGSYKIPIGRAISRNPVSFKLEGEP